MAETTTNIATNQIYGLVNDVATMALGSSAIKAVDTSTFISLGKSIFDAGDRTVDAFFKTLDDVIGRTTAAIRMYKAPDRSAKKDEFEYGAMYRKVHYTLGEARENPTWLPPQKDPYSITPNTKIEQVIFKAIGTYEYDDVIPYRQLTTAFNDEMSMNAIISGIYTNRDNFMELSLSRLTAFAVNTYMAGVINSGKASCFRNVLKEYNTKNSTTLKVANCMDSLDFLRYATTEINLCQKNMRDFSTVFNVMGSQKHTPADKVVVEINSIFSTHCESYLQADTYHKELVALPHYEEVNFWQAPVDYSFANTSAIAITLPAGSVGNTSDITVNQSGIIACIHDYDAIASTIFRRRNYTKFNEYSEVLNIMDKADKGMICDLRENGVVFYIEDEPDTPTPEPTTQSEVPVESPDDVLA